jgi:hypothetical protein
VYSLGLTGTGVAPKAVAMALTSADGPAKMEVPVSTTPLRAVETDEPPKVTPDIAISQYVSEMSGW